mmetsp:Transcript_11642/g.18936  ORF Transcript_11642/g.18936 Transcript_11642/m.18936 type:complete len:564 (+) Transcript_11642:44-1735(+)|eukprot:CAMPEP_0184340062 /NCGR_PEP_ID=MMETSP1089-20130417/8721_1 /TAXON_ID=38269 ORGANISM="Gloeochaete wittrockiana, Strain SAG46.84" /NCGR_SAMPLE_ID=MMETSP1089 /ASSEMBLY_ACC=CAM_ASM_000445 /LENGTH=563 /DNA_ID=CAMNT_0026667665 /DNA_START=41 /DNA_END=1732 /DNA_ORIENTATION=-
MHFSTFGIDDRILNAITHRLGYSDPTLVQLECIPLALEGKDILACARTGSGKTVAYVVPLLQKLLLSDTRTGIEGLILVPTKELCEQVRQVISDLSHYCHDRVSCVAISADQSVALQKLQINNSHPNIIVATPARLAQHLKVKNINLHETLKMLIVDEADLILSYGYEEDMKEIARSIPSICQKLMMSATMSEEVGVLEKLLLDNPVSVDMTEAENKALEEATSSLDEYSISIGSNDKYLLLHALFKLHLIVGKCLVFVNGIDSCYRLKLFLDAFGVRSAVLNSELPHSSRLHCLDQFNKGIYDYLIAGDDESVGGDSAGGQQPPAESSAKPKSSKRSSSSAKAPESDKEFLLSRGVDFKHVSTVINFDFPKTSKTYIHRIGRTARGGHSGTAISFVSESEEKQLQRVMKKQSAGPTGTPSIKPFNFRLTEIEGFRYRVEDVLRSITKRAIQEARMKDIRQEVLNSERLKSYFDEHPKDLQVLKHDKTLSHQAKIKPHLKHIPGYLLPQNMRSTQNVRLPEPTFVKKPRKQASTGKRRRSSNDSRDKSKKKKRRGDPLTSFTA